MKKLFQNSIIFLFLGFMFSLGILLTSIGIYYARSRSSVSPTSVSEPDNALTAIGGDKLTLTKWNSLIQRVSGINTKTDGTVFFTGGDVGIGTINPSFKLDIDNNLKIQKSGGSSRIEIRGGSDGTNSSSLYMYNPSNQLSAAFSDGIYSSYMNLYGGNFGLGTNDPQYKIEVLDKHNGRIARFGDIYGANMTITTKVDTDRIVLFAGEDTSGIALGGANIEYMRIRPNGNVGIGTTSPSHLLHVNGIARSTQSSFATSSDKRVKKNISSLNNSLEKISKLNPVNFEYTSEYSAGNNSMKGIKAGFIAQEVEKIIPELVSIIKEKVNNEEFEDFRLLNSGDLIPYLVQAIKELKSENEILIQENNDIKQRLEMLENR